MNNLILCLCALTLVTGCEKGDQNPNRPQQEIISNELIEKARAGNSDTQFELGKRQINQNTDESIKEGFSWISRAATNGLAEAQCYVGASYFKGEIVKRDSYEAKRWLKKAVDNGVSSACRILGYMEWENGYREEAIKYFQKGMYYGDVIAMCCLARLYLSGNPIIAEQYELEKSSNKALAVKLLAAAAEKGYSPARYELIRLFITDGAFELAAEKLSLWYDGNDPNFAFLQGMYCLAARNPKRDVKFGKDCLMLAANAGVVRAMRELGMVATDKGERRVWFEKAAKNGDDTALFYLGGEYLNKEDGIEKDIAKALKCIETAGRCGNSKAQSALAIMYFYGAREIEGKRDIKKGLKWARRAAVHHDAESEYIIGCSYVKGEGCDVDMSKAIEWFTRAKLDGSERAGHLLDELEDLWKTIQGNKNKSTKEN